MDRRSFLKITAVGAGAAAGTALTGPAFSQALALPDGPFQYGVASGDPLPDGAVLWTRVTPSPDATPGSGLGAPTPVRWEVVTATGTPVRSGVVTSSPSSDHTVKLAVSGLAAATTYFYRFTALGGVSTIGRFRTAPGPNANNSRLRFGFVSCSNYEGGFFSAYRHLARRNDLDFVLHDGDYMYEYAVGGYGPGANFTPPRRHDPPNEMVSLEDYRRRHAVYKSDPDLAALHAKAAWITTIDDHEVTNDSHRTGAENHQPATEGDYVTRRNASFQAYVEWMPIRAGLPSEPGGTVLYRRLGFGRLADVTMLDLRTYRDAPAATAAAGRAAGRTQTGPDQEQFLNAVLDDPVAPRWRLIGNSVQIMQVIYAGPFFASNGDGTSRNTDAWDGYTAQRTALLTRVAANAQRYDAVFLTGDIHSTWAADLPINFDGYPGVSTPLQPSVATEFVCTSVTSDNLDEILGAPPRTASVPIENGILAANRHIKRLEFDSHGYSVVDVTPARLQCDWYYISNREDPNATQSPAPSFQTVYASKVVTTAAAPVPDDGAVLPAPAFPAAPDAVIPESPSAALLPLGALALAAGAVALRRRGATAEDAPTT